MDLDSHLLNRQLEELQLIQCSLMPDERFSFNLPDEDAEEWASLLHKYSSGDDTLDRSHPATPCRFKVAILDVPLHFEVELPRGYPRHKKSIVSVRGDSIGRPLQEEWQKIVAERLEKLQQEEIEFIIHALLCMDMLPLLHEKASEIISRDDGQMAEAKEPADGRHSLDALYHALLTSHHLISPTKRRNLQKWSTELSLHGFAKVGYPGCIYAEGPQNAVEEFVTRIKAMQWLALRVRFSEPLDIDRYGRLSDSRQEASGARASRWIEFEKVGDVVQEMRRAGREEFVTEMGLGSAGAPT